MCCRALLQATFATRLGRSRSARGCTSRSLRSSGRRSAPLLVTSRCRDTRCVTARCRTLGATAIESGTSGRCRSRCLSSRCRSSVGATHSGRLTASFAISIGRCAKYEQYHDTIKPQSRKGISCGSLVEPWWVPCGPPGYLYWLPLDFPWRSL